MSMYNFYKSGLKRFLGFFLLIILIGLSLYGQESIPISYGQTVSNSLTDDEVDTYTFNAAAGDKVVIRVAITSGTLSPSVQLYGPDGTELGRIYSMIVSNPLPSTGNYTIRASYYQDYSCEYNLTLERVNPGTGPSIEFGQTISGNLQVGDSNTYTFSANSGDSVIIRIVSISVNLSPYVYLYAPDGTRIASGKGGTFINPLPVTGVYTIFAYNTMSQTGDYNLTLERLNPGIGPYINYGQTISDKLQLGDLNTYTFSANQGDKVIIRMTRTSGFFIPLIRFYGPDGARLSSSKDGYDFLSNSLPSSGTYTILASDYSGVYSGGDYNLTLDRLNPGTGAAITFGQTVSATLQAGDLNTHTFSANQGDKVIIRKTVTSGSLERSIRLYGPDGTKLAVGTWEIMSNLLPGTGTYTILVSDSYGSKYGDYLLSLERLNPGVGPSITYGQTVSGTLQAGGLNTHTFSANQGDIVIIKGEPTSGSIWLSIQLFAPDGTNLRNLKNDYYKHEVISNSLLSTGIYTILFSDSNLVGSGDYNLTLERLNPGSGPSINFGQTVLGQLQVGDLNTYTFSADNGNRIKIKVTVTQGDFNSSTQLIKLFDPDGTEIRLSLSFYNGINEVEVVSDPLPNTGIYTILVSDSGDGKGSYKLIIDRHESETKLELTQQVDKLYVWHGAELTYTTIYKNNVDIDASNVVIEVQFPSSLEMLEGSISNGGNYNSSTRLIMWNVGTLTAGGTEQTVSFKAKVPQGISNGTKIVVIAKISSLEDPSPITASASTTVASPSIESISPNRGGNVGPVTVSIKGQCLDPAAKVKLSASGKGDIVANTVTGVIDGTQLKATFDLKGKSPGTWDLVITNLGEISASLYNAFTIESGGKPKLWTEIIGSDQIRVGRPTEYIYRYGNDGNVDIEIVFVELKLPEEFECITIEDENQNIIWNKDINSKDPLYFVMPPIRTGEVRELQVKINAKTILDPNISLKSLLVFTCSAILRDPIPDFAKTFIEHKWDECGPQDQDIVPYLSDLSVAFGTALEEFWKEYSSPEALLAFLVEEWFNLQADKMLKILDEMGKKTAYRFFKRLKMAIDLADTAFLLWDNISSNPYVQQKIAETKKNVTPVISVDPNNKSGPAGYDLDGIQPQSQKHFISSLQSLLYMVQFENLENATATVQDMKITDQLEENFEWATFSFNSIQVGNHTITVPKNRMSFNTSLDLRPDMNTIVDVECTFNSSSGRAQWIFSGKDPVTGKITDFLPPNKANVDPKGRGWVTYSVKPKENLPSGTIIRNKATIDFEIGIPPAPMDTPEWRNTIDNTKPSSQVLALSPTQTSSSFTVIWEGTDEHSDIRNYSIYVSDNGGSYVEWLTGTSKTSDTFTGAQGHSYAFYSIATDNVGNQEDVPSSPDTTTTVGQSSGTPVINLNCKALHFGAVPGGEMTESQCLLISNTSNGLLNWTATTNQNWIQVSPSTGTGNSILTVSVDTSGLSEGNYNGGICVSDSNASNSPQTVAVTLTVYKPGQTTGPFGEFATPVDGSMVRSSIPVTGWVLDDIGVESLKIYRTEGNSLVYIGDAVFVEGARSDVEQAYPGYPMNHKAGWGYMMLTYFLPNGGNGTFSIHAIATDIEGYQAALGTKTIICDNDNAVKPFGAIDTPTQGGEASGSSFRNQGWVLTPFPNSIPTNGSTINVFVDGINLGHPTYNVYRSDIATLFPGYANSNGAHAYFDFDTTAYDNGVHIIYWTAEDSAGNSDGVGSRYFTIQNIGNSGSSNSVARYQHQAKELAPYTLSQIAEIPCYDLEPIKIKKNLNTGSGFKVIYADEEGTFYANIRELEQIEIELSKESSVTAGYNVVGDELRSLPVGAILNTKYKKFFWKPGPGFVGEYRFVFIEKSEDSQLKKKNVIVRIEPKFTK